MFIKLCLLVIALTTVTESCVKNSYKRHGEACGCTDACLDNSYCLKDQDGALSCACLPCQYFDTKLGQCVNVPSLGEPCTGTCAPNYTCAENPDGNRTCQECSIHQYYDMDVMDCVDLPGYGEPCKGECCCNLACQSDTASPTSRACGCPADSPGYDAELGICQFECLTDTPTGCRCVPDGDYPACFPKCQDGAYVSCSNDILYMRDCALGWYKEPDGTRFTAKLVFDPPLKRCERRSDYCPRDLDQKVEG